MWCVVEELLALRERLPVRVRPPDTLEPRPRRTEQGVIHAQDHLPHHLDQARTQEQVVALVHRARL